MGINNHIFSDRAQSARVHAKDGWLRVERTRVAAHRREWRTGKRDAEQDTKFAAWISWGDVSNLRCMQEPCQKKTVADQAWKNAGNSY